jgi:hypothetical protein
MSDDGPRLPRDLKVIAWLIIAYGILSLASGINLTDLSALLVSLLLGFGLLNRWRYCRACSVGLVRLNLVFCALLFLLGVIGLLNPAGMVFEYHHQKTTYQ